MQSARNAIKKANMMPSVENFIWHAYYPCINAIYNGKGWDITYYDVVGDGYHNQPLKVTVS